MNRTASLSLACVLALATGCGDSAAPPAPPVPSEGSAALPPGHPAVAAPVAAPARNPEDPPLNAAPGALRVGVVQETIESAGYVYVRMQTGGTETWIAAPATTVAVGDRVEAPIGSLMPEFHSNSLDRTFPELWFVPFVRPEGSASSGVAAPSAPPPAAAAVPTGPVEPLAGGSTVAAVYALAADADVGVRGRVVKVNRGILGFDWVHLQDGSGTAAERNDDLLVTAAPGTTVQPGDVVVARGKVVRDKDFGAGYAYSVLLEATSLAGE
jgi:uncharacterized protein YdeI (BOF family)